VGAAVGLSKGEPVAVMGAPVAVGSKGAAVGDAPPVDAPPGRPGRPGSTPPVTGAAVVELPVTGAVVVVEPFGTGAAVEVTGTAEGTPVPLVSITTGSAGMVVEPPPLPATGGLLVAPPSPKKVEGTDVGSAVELLPGTKGAMFSW
jgi:hypothetical protein